MIVPTHYLLLENLLWDCKVLNINTPRKRKVPKETNWKQKFQKPQNENICLTYLNTENKRNFHFMSFDIAIRMVKKVRKIKLFVDSRIRFDYAISWIIICERWVLWVSFHSVFKKILLLFVWLSEVKNRLCRGNLIPLHQIIINYSNMANLNRIKVVLVEKGKTGKWLCRRNWQDSMHS